jgi:predicted transcriptional regulator
MTESDKAPELSAPEALQLAAEIVSAYVSNNQVPAEDVPSIIRSVHATLGALGRGVATGIDLGQRPAVPVKKSVTDAYIICLEDGRKLKMLKRYLRSHYNMTPEQYRAKWQLPPDYPMVAPNYAAQRSEFAKKIGLGRSGRGRPPKRPRRRAN